MGTPHPQLRFLETEAGRQLGGEGGGGRPDCQLLSQRLALWQARSPKGTGPPACPGAMKALCLSSSLAFAKDQMAEENKKQHGVFQNGFILMASATEGTVSLP